LNKDQHNCVEAWKARLQRDTADKMCLQLQLIVEFPELQGHYGYYNTFHRTQANIPYLNPSQTGQYSIYLLQRDGSM